MQGARREQVADRLKAYAKVVLQYNGVLIKHGYDLPGIDSPNGYREHG